MNAYNLAKTAYTASAVPIRTHSGNEYEAFARVTLLLKNASATSKTRFSETAQAIFQNRQLWTLLAADVASKDNQLPAQLRAQIFYLAEFTTVHSRKVLHGEASVDALVDINTAIMRGLRRQAEAA
ncbi:MAG: flagellar biosynthesis regulator FlaF [Halocynthiibacter sp.]